MPLLIVGREVVRPLFTDLITPAWSSGSSHRIELGEGGGFLFGGLTMGIALRAAGSTVDNGLLPKSLRMSFVAFGTRAPLDATVEDVQSGRSFARRGVRIRQERRTVATAEATFHLPEEGVDRQRARAPDVPGPEALLTVPSMLPEAHVIVLKPIDPSAHGAGRIHPYWCRIDQDLGDVPLVQAAGLAFMSDYMVVHSPFEPGEGEAESMSSFTLEHCLWFHRPFRSDDWLLFDTEPLSRSEGRFLSRGTVFDRRGTLVASFVQEGLTRRVPHGAGPRGEDAR